MKWLVKPRKNWQVVGQFLGLFLCCCFLIVSCGGSNSNKAVSPSGGASNSGTTAKASDRVAIGTTDPPRTLDPADGYEVAITNIHSSLGDRLYTYKKDSFDLEPQLATAMPKVSSDNLTYTIPTRTGVTFHDGEPFNAKAMEFSLNRFIKNGGKPSTLLSSVVDSIKATGDNELTIKLKYPFAPFPSLLAFSGMCAVSPKAYADQVGPGKFLPQKFVGTGPYKLTSFTANQSVKLDAFDKYWGEKPPNKGLDFQIFSTPANLYNSFTTGAVDVAYDQLDSNQIVTLKQQGASKGYQIVEQPGSGIDYIVLNMKAKPLDKLEVRQAFAAMVDRPLLAQRVYQGQADPIYSIVPTSFDSYKGSFKDAYGDGNVAKAKELLTKAGFSKAKPAQIDLYYSTSQPERAQTAATLQEYAAQKLEGILQIKPQAVDSTTLFANAGKGTYPSYLVAWYPDFGDADNYIQPIFQCDKGSAAEGCKEGASQSQGMFYYSEQLNKLVLDERKAQKPEDRKKTFAEIQDLLAKDVPYIPLYQRKNYAFTNQKIKDVVINPVIGPTFWDINKGA